MLDLIRFSLIILLSLSVLITPGLYVLQGFLHGYTSSGIFIMSILCITQLSLSMILCITKNIATLLIFLIINTLIIITAFIIEIVWLYHFIDHSEQKFYELMDKYPHGTIPDQISLIPAYIAIKDKKCCGILDNVNLNIQEFSYFHNNFGRNCDKLYQYLSKKSIVEYHGQPCMNFVYDMHHILLRISGAKMIFIIFILVLFGIYIFLRRREQKRLNQPLIGTLSNQRMIYPSHTFITNPNGLTPPPYQDISQYEQQINDGI